MAREPDAIAELRRALGAQLATFRLAADLTQGQLAEAAFCDRTTVAHIEKGRARADQRFWQAVDEACRANGALLAAFTELEAAKFEHERQEREQRLAVARARAAELRAGQGAAGSQLQVVPHAHGAGQPGDEDQRAAFSGASISGFSPVSAGVVRDGMTSAFEQPAGIVDALRRAVLGPVPEAVGNAHESIPRALATRAGVLQ